MSFTNYLHENFAEIETEIITESYSVDEYYDVEDLFESIRTFKDIPNNFKKILVTAFKKAGEASNVKDLEIQSEGKITTKTALQNALKTSLNPESELSGFVIEANGVAALVVTKTYMDKFNVHAEGTETVEKLNQAQAIVEIKKILDALEGGLSAAFKGKGIEIKAVYADKNREAVAAARGDNKESVLRKKFAKTELSADERKRVIDKFAKKYITAKVDKLVKALPEALGNTDTLLQASIDRQGFEHKKIAEIADLVRELSNSLDAYRFASSEDRIRNFDGEVTRYIKDIKKGS